MPRNYVSYDKHDGGSKVPPLTAEQARKMAPNVQDIIDVANSRINMSIMAAANEGQFFARIYPYDLKDVSKIEGALFDIKLGLVSRGFSIHMGSDKIIPMGISWFGRELTDEEEAEILGSDIQCAELENRDKMLKKYKPEKEIALHEASRNIAEQISHAMWRGETFMVVPQEDMRFLSLHGIALDLVNQLQKFGFGVEYTQPDFGYLTGKSMADGAIKVKFY